MRQHSRVIASWKQNYFDFKAFKGDTEFVLLSSKELSRLQVTEEMGYINIFPNTVKLVYKTVHL